MLTRFVDTIWTTPAPSPWTKAAHKSFATSAAVPIPVSTATATLLSRPGLVDRYSASAEFLAVECADCNLSFCTGRHFNKGEPFGAVRIAITDHMDLLDMAMSFERLA